MEYNPNMVKNESIKEYTWQRFDLNHKKFPINTTEELGSINNVYQLLRSFQKCIRVHLSEVWKRIDTHMKHQDLSETLQ